MTQEHSAAALRALAAPTLFRAGVALAFAAATIFVTAPSHAVGTWLLALWFALAFSVLCLTVLLVNAVVDGATRLDGNLFTQYSSRLRPARRGLSRRSSPMVDCVLPR